MFEIKNSMTGFSSGMDPTDDRTSIFEESIENLQTETQRKKRKKNVNMRKEPNRHVGLSQSASTWVTGMPAGGR